MKVIFLDIDGVLNSDNFYEEIFRNKPENQLVTTNGVWRYSYDAGGIDSRCVKWLNKVTNDTGAVIVVTSSWRKEGLEGISSILAKAGVKGQVVGITKFRVNPDTAERMLKQSLSQKWGGRKVSKKSDKPFKCGLKVATVEEVALSHPHHPDVMAFKIKEDGTLVEAWRCEDVESGEAGPRSIDELSFIDKAERGIEVHDWLEANKDRVSSYVMIDDDSDFLERQKSNLIKVNRRVGFTENDSEKAIEILNRNGI